jgi:hypothetical protein
MISPLKQNRTVRSLLVIPINSTIAEGTREGYGCAAGQAVEQR